MTDPVIRMEQPRRPGDGFEIRQALREGVRRLRRGGRAFLWIYLLSLGLVLIPTAVVCGAIEDSLAQSLMAERLQVGFDDHWYREFGAEARGLAATFRFSVVGAGALLDGFEDFLDGDLFDLFGGLLGLGLAYLCLWTFLSGGLLHLYNTTDPPTLESFMAGSGRHFFRFLKLLLLAALVYGSIYRFLLPGLAELVEVLTRDQVDERMVFFWTLAKYGLVAGALLLVNLVMDYAKIFTVIEGRRSALLAVARAVRFILAEPARTLGLYLALAGVGLVFLLGYALLAPGASQDNLWKVGLALLTGQVYIASRIGVRLLFLASQSALCGALLERPRMEIPG